MSAAKSRFSQITVGLGLLVVGVLAVNIIASVFNFRLDFTEEKSYSLSAASKKILSKVEDDIEVKFYFSKSLKETPMPIQTYATRVGEILREFAKLSHGKIKVSFVDPKPDTDEEEWARKYGLSPVRLPQGSELYFGAVFLQGKQEEAIGYFDPRREDQLEYDLAEVIVRLGVKEKSKVGIFSSLNIWGNPMAGAPAFAFIDELRRTYDVVNLSDSFRELSQVKLAILAHPKMLGEAQNYALEQFLLHGGRLIILLDGFSRTDLAMVAQSMEPSQAFEYKASSDVAGLMRDWGITFEGDKIAGDFNFATMINTEAGTLSYPFFMSLNKDAFNKENRITAQLNSFLYAEGGAFKISDNPQIKWQDLISTSGESGASDPKMLRFVGPMNFTQEFKPDSTKRVLAALGTGKFPSHFKQAPQGGAEIWAQPPLQEAETDSYVLVMGDFDFIADQNSVDRFRFGNQVVMRPKNDNLAFLLNAVEFMSGQEDLIAIRSRGRTARPFTKIMEMQKDAQVNWKNVEDELSKKISEVQERINNLQAQRTDGSSFTLTAEQQSEIDKFRAEELTYRKKRREVRKNLREDIEKLEGRLIALNMLVVPAGVLVGAYLTLSRRSRALGRKKGDVA